MFTTGSKMLYGFAIVMLVAAIVYGISEGELLGLVAFLSASLATAFLASVVVALRDAEGAPVPVVVTGTADAEGAVGGGEAVADSPWPIVAAFGAALLGIGLVTESLLFFAGSVALVIVLIEWMVQAWADRASADPAYNRSVRNGILSPFELPAAGLLIVAVVIVGFSRVLLALPSDGSIVVFIVAAVVLLAVAAAVATRPHVGTTILAGLLLLGGLAVLSGGIVGAAAGEREFHEEPEDEIDPTQNISNRGVITQRIVADDIAYSETELFLPRAVSKTILFSNQDTNVPHSLHVVGPVVDEAETAEEGDAQEAEGAEGEEGEGATSEEEADAEGEGEGEGEGVDIATAVAEGPNDQNLLVRLDNAGVYEFFCDIHPEQMRGTITVS